MRCSRRAVPGRLAAALAAALAFTGACLVPGTAHAASCTVTWAGPAGATDLSGSWDDATNWSTGAVPTSDDDVCVTAPGTYTVTMTADEAVHSLVVGDGGEAPTLQMVGPMYGAVTRTLDIAADSTIGRGATLQMTGYLMGADTVAVASGATLTNDGTIEVDEGFGVTEGMGGPGLHKINGGFDNQGTVFIAPNDDPSDDVLMFGGPVSNLDGAGTLTGGVWESNGYLGFPTDTFITVNAAKVILHHGATVWGATVAGYNLFRPRLNVGSIILDGGYMHVYDPLDNRGAVDVVNGGVLEAEDGYTQDAPTTGPPPVTTVRGTFPDGGIPLSQIDLHSSTLVVNDGTLTGDGYLYGPGGVINAGGVVRPDPVLHLVHNPWMGSPPGGGPYTQLGGGVLDVTMTDATHATAIQTGGSITLGGTLRITTPAGVTPSPGVNIPIFTTPSAGPLSTFGTVTSVPASSQRTWQVTATPITASVSTAPAVTIRSMLAPTLTETLSSSSVIYGAPLRVTGRLTAAGAADANARVTLYRQAPGSSAWTAMAAGTTNSTGAVAFSVTPTATFRYRLDAAADSTHLEATSASLTGSVHTQFTLTAGHQLTSPNGSYRLIMQSDGNLVEYGPGSRVAWSSHTNGHAGAYLAMQSDGNAVIYAGGRPLWSTRTSPNPGARLVVQNDGNVVVYSTANRPLWSSWANPSRSLAGVRPQ